MVAMIALVAYDKKLKNKNKKQKSKTKKNNSNKCYRNLEKLHYHLF